MSDYKNTQPYRLGQMYRALGEMLMDPMTDLRDLVALCGELGVDLSISISLGGDDHHLQEGD